MKYWPFLLCCLFAAKECTAMKEKPNCTPNKDNIYNAKLSEQAEWNAETDTFSLFLTCGPFIFPDNRNPFNAMWTIPNGSTRESTKYRNGMFYLQLDNPIATGPYYCKIPKTYPPKPGYIDCKTTPENGEVHVMAYVGESKARMLLLESENQLLKQKMWILTEREKEMMNTIFRLTNRTDANIDGTSMRNCQDWSDFPSGTRTIYLANNQTVEIYCDQKTVGGRWNVFQKRNNGFFNFYRPWNDYRDGFGDPDREYWLGLETLHQMTSDGGKYELRFDLEMQNGSRYYEVYDNFSIGSESEGYAVRFAESGYRGNAGDSFSGHRNFRFTTMDRDHDIAPNGNCAVNFIGAWWYRGCHDSNLNGNYNDTRYGKGLNWQKLTGYEESLKKTEIKFRATQ